MSTLKSSTTISKLAVAAFAAALSLSATADTYKWDNNGGDNRMANGDNWYLSGSPADNRTRAVPAQSDKAEISSSAPAELNANESFSVASMYVGRGGESDTNHPKVDLNDGTFTVAGNLMLGHWGERSEMNILGGTVTLGSLSIGNLGSRFYNKFNVSGNGAVTIQGELKLGTESKDARGEMTVSGGSVNAQGKVSVGNCNLSEVGGADAFKSTLSVSGGTMTAASMEVGNATSAGGQVTVSGNGVLTVSGDLSVGNAQGAVGYLTVNGGEFRSEKMLNIGNSSGSGSLTVGGTGVFRDDSSGNDYVHFNGADGLLRLNEGGKFYFRAILDGTKGTVEFNGGEMIKYTKSAAYGVSGTAIESKYTIKILAGGMIFNSDYTSTCKAAMVCPEDCGGITKRGSGELNFNNQSFKYSGPIYVEGGILTFSGNTEFPDFVDIIRVAEGATLVIPHDLTCRVLENNGTIQGGTVTVESDAATKVATKAVWTGAMEDGDVYNVKNYIVYDQNDRIMYKQTITVDMPVVVPYRAGVPSFDGFSDVTWVVEDDTRSEGYSRPAALNAAAAWYDPSDDDTLTRDDENKVTAIQNKGTVGATLDLGLRSSSKGGATVVNNAFNGRSSLYINNNNTSGYRSTGVFPAGVPSSGPRTLFVVAKGKSVAFLSMSQAGGSEEGRSLILAGDGFGQAYQVGYFETTDGVSGSWAKGLASFTYSDAEPYVFSGRTLQGDGYTNDVMSCVIAANGTSNGGTNKLYMPVSEESLEFKTYYGTFDIQGGYNKDMTGWIGEALIFTNALTDAEMDAVNAYLKGKWLDSNAMPDFDSLVVNAQVDLGGATRTFEKLSGSGSFVDGTVVLTGDLVVTVNTDGSVVAPSFDKLVLGENARLVVKGAKYLPTKGTVAIAVVSSLQGEFATAVGDAGVKPRVFYSDGSIDARRDPGMQVTIR